MSASQPPSPGWFEHAQRWGITMPLARTARLYRGMSLAQTPPGLPLTRRSPRRGSLVGAAGGGLLASQGRDAERRCPHRRGMPGPRLVHTPSEPSGSQRSLAVHRSPRWQVRSWGNKPGWRTLIRIRSLQIRICCTQSPAPPAEPRAPEEGLLEGGLVVEVATALGLPLPTLAPLARLNCPIGGDHG